MVRIPVLQRFLHHNGTRLLRARVYHYTNHFMAPNEERWHKLKSPALLLYHSTSGLKKAAQRANGRGRIFSDTMSPRQGRVPFFYHGDSDLCLLVGRIVFVFLFCLFFFPVCLLMSDLYRQCVSIKGTVLRPPSCGLSRSSTCSSTSSVPNSIRWFCWEIKWCCSFCCVFIKP